ncbi:hypothetical protein PG993_000597 [Apiospora rasikravindrae]|uniref:Arabinogalactan endo-beta-1,4-galactanase n=1 Tax=Apiospora rasikravindrae TaxID=990691 RepID=A0ABR1UBC0_9PEZI
MDVYIDLHYSDTWADPAHQKIPAGWPTDADNLAWRVYNYTLDVSNQFAAAGIAPKIMSIGNEITAGTLFPTGSTSNFYNLARILHSASSGIKDSKLSTKPRIMIHLDNGWKWDTQKWCNSAATLSSLKTSLTNMANTWGKEIVVAETNWPTSCPSPQYAFPSDLKNIPFSAAGQKTFVQKVAATVSGVKNGVGLFYWEPAWVDNAGLGSSCSSNTMFAWPGTALDSLSVFSTI